MNEHDYTVRDMQEMRKDLDSLYRTVYQGNGTPSLVNQVSKLEHRLTTMEEKMDSSFESIDTEMTLKFKNITDVVNERFNLISYQITQEFEKKRTEHHASWNKKTSFIAACIAGVCSILSVFVSEVFRYVK
jgi:phosphotransacetylase